MRVVVTGPAFPLNFAALWVAADRSFFREEGLDVEFRPVLELQGGEHPRFAWRREGLIVFHFPAGSPPFRSVLERRGVEDAEINVVSTACRTAHVLVARQGIDDPSGLRGCRLGADRKGGSSMDARVVLRHFGLDPDSDVTWIDSRGRPPDTERYRLQLFERGEIDAVCCDPPHWNQAVEMGGRRLTSTRDLFTLPEAGLSTTRLVIEQHPALVLAMVRAAVRGAEFARVNREETVDAILRHNLNITRRMATEAWKAHHDDWGPVLDAEAHRRKVEIYTREWNLPSLPVAAYYEFGFLKQAMRELGLLRSWDPALDEETA